MIETLIKYYPLTNKKIGKNYHLSFEKYKNLKSQKKFSKNI